jgi:hypothetical protein
MRRLALTRHSGDCVAGYSGRSLVDKLGIKPGMVAAILNPPKGYGKTLGPLPAGVRLATRPARGTPFIQLFTTRRAELAVQLPKLGRAIAPDGMLWISWPKGTSGVKTDVTEDVIRDLALPLGLVDVKVCAVDETWSGLKLVWRKTRR